MRHANSLVVYSGGSYILLSFAYLFRLSLNPIAILVAMCFMLYSFSFALRMNPEAKFRIPLIISALAFVILYATNVYIYPIEEPILVLMPVMSIGFFYLLRFTFKREKKLFDVLKLLFFVSLPVAYTWYYMHFSNSRPVFLVHFAISMASYSYFIFSKENIGVIRKTDLPRTEMNAEDIKKSRTIGCHNCLTIYDSPDEVDYHGATAVCPNCGSATLIGSFKYNVNPESLQALQRAKEQARG